MATKTADTLGIAALKAGHDALELGKIIDAVHTASVSGELDLFEFRMSLAMDALEITERLRNFAMLLRG